MADSVVRMLIVAVCLMPVFVIAGPKLGDGPRWNLGRAVEGKKRVVEKEDVERELGLIKRMLACLREVADDELWDEMQERFEFGYPGSSELERMEEICEDIGDAATTSDYIQQLEQENRMLREGSDARCTRMLQQALDGSDDADVDFVFDNGQMGAVKGHRGMLCAGSEEYAGLFRSGMLEAQEGKIRVPPVIGVASFRGFLEWLYLGEMFAVLVASMHAKASSSAWKVAGIRIIESQTKEISVYACWQGGAGRSALRPTGGSCGCWGRCTMLLVCGSGCSRRGSTQAACGRRTSFGLWRRG